MAKTRETLMRIEIGKIGPNPHRDLAKYPPEEDRVRAIVDSIRDVGWFPGGLIVRPTPPGRGRPYEFEQAYGHRRLQAARIVYPNPKHKLMVVVRDMDDAEMLKLMVRENLSENVGRDFLMLLETWEATRRFLTTDTHEPGAVEIAEFMGWDRPTKRDGRMILTNNAYGCNAAHELLESGLVTRDMFEDLPLGDAVKIARHYHGRVRSLAAKNLRPERADAERSALQSEFHETIERVRHRAADRQSGEDAMKQLRQVAKGERSMPDYQRAIEQTRKMVKAWDVGGRVGLICSVASDADRQARELLSWLAKDLRKVATLSEAHAKQIEAAIKPEGNGTVIEAGGMPIGQTPLIEHRSNSDD